MTRATARGAALVLGVGALGVTLAVQGWRSWPLDNDLVEYVDAAHALLAHGRIPDHGVITGFGSYAPPGLAWFAVPGAALLSDPRLIDVPGNVILYLGTLAGIFLLARACCGDRCALLAVLLYGVSERGLLFAGSVGSSFPGPRGHPFFYVWMTYWTWKWVARGDARYLAAALVTWVAGMYVFMELAPAIFILPVIWFFYRPPVCFQPLVLACALALLIWYPYLRFEAARGFADIRSQVLMERLQPADYTKTLCNPALRVGRSADLSATIAPDGPRAYRPAGFAMTAARRGLAITKGLVVNFDSLVPGAGVTLLALTCVGLFVLGIGWRAPSLSSRVVTAAAIGLLACGAVANEIVIVRALGSRAWFTPDVISTIRTFQLLAALTGVALLMRDSIGRFVRSVAAGVGARSTHSRVLAIALIVPWAILLLVAEWGRQDRLMGLWPLQVIVLACACVAVFERLHGTNARARQAAELVIVGVVLANPLVVSRIDEWRHGGWSGTEAVETQAADYLAARIRSEGRDRAVIGYRMFEDTPPEPPWRAVNRRWRYGAEFDVLLEYRDRISNLNRCGESLSAQDEYRIVAAHPPTAEYSYYFDAPPGGAPRFLKQFGNYQVFRIDR